MDTFLELALITGSCPSTVCAVSNWLNRNTRNRQAIVIFTPMDFLYLLGVICTISLKNRLNKDILLNPAIDATLAMDWSECVSNAQAFWILISVNACLKVLPVVCLNQ